jgi:hypothetical protein
VSLIYSSFLTNLSIENQVVRMLTRPCGSHCYSQGLQLKGSQPSCWTEVLVPHRLPWMVPCRRRCSFLSQKRPDLWATAFDEIFAVGAVVDT